MKKDEKKKMPPRKKWVVAAAAILTFAIIVNVLAMTTFFDLISGFLGRKIPVYADGVESMYPALNSDSKSAAFYNANNKNIEVCEEGFVLLKNDNQTLPLNKGEKISVFGKNSVNLSYGGSGSSAFKGISYKTVEDSLTAVGFSVNPTLKAFYEDNSKSGGGRTANSNDLDSGDNQVIAVGETPIAQYTEQVKKSYQDYQDAAIVVITRIGGEGFDLPRYQGATEGAVSPDSHYLELDQNEIDLLTEVTENFEKVIVIFNIPAAFEATFLKSTAYAPFADKIDAALWVGFTGGEGIMALGSILSGDVNPSGRTVDTWAADFTKDPTFVNFGTGPSPDDTDKYDAGLYYFVDYEEGVYVGYRYYESRGYGDEVWYQENVVYPFGYGMSYTDFQWEVLENKDPADGFAVFAAGIELNPMQKYEIAVKVTNVGQYAGKDVVELYGTAPYEVGGIEKAYKVLLGFVKTGVLEPGESQIVKLSFDPYHLASYDYRDANANGFNGYELEAGDYQLHVSKNAHEAVTTLDCSVVNDGWLYETDPVTGNYVENRYTDTMIYMDSDAQLSTVLSRSDWEGTWPDKPSAEEHIMSRAMQQEFKDSEPNNPNDYSEEDFPEFSENKGLTLRNLLPENAPENTWKAIVSYDDNRWDDILSQCSAEELAMLLNYGCYQTVAVNSIDMPATQHGDGPSGFTYFLNKGAVSGTCHYCSEPAMAATWNVELIEELGECIGEEGVWGNETSGQPYTSIYAPGVNIHRSMFGGRCAEYFSEDPVLSGKMAASEIRGCQSRGVVCMVKHFAANEQETHRARFGDCSWVTEQALREIFLKSFEIAVKEGESRGLMTSFNRIGLKWTGGDYRLCTEILRDEWGFCGTVICDFNTHPEYMFSRQMAYAGGNLNLANTPVDWCDFTDTQDVMILRKCAKNILYSFVNSNAMNGQVIAYRLPTWSFILFAVDTVLICALAVAGFISFRKKRICKS